ncbi:UNVERIFIED_ORG: hypothetical protein J2X79_001977 [Arthrobacter globiformis]|nr:hypothetical protein [Arthrobacter globiformis]
MEAQLSKPKQWHVVGQAAQWFSVPSLADKRNIRVGEFRQAIRQHAPSELLPAIARISSGLREYEFDQGWRLYSPWATAAVARESLVHGTEHRTRPVTDRSLRRIFNLFNLAENGIPDGDELHLMISGFVYEQATYQDTPLYDLARTLLLLRDTEIVAPEIPKRDWREILGVDLDEWLVIVFALATAAKNNAGQFDRNAPSRDNWREIDFRLSPERVDIVLEQLTVDVDAFRMKTASAPSTADHLWRFSYNQLKNTPFIDFAKGALIAPQYLFILQAMMIENIFYRVGRKWKLFPEELGYRVEAYTGRQLRYAGFSSVTPEITYDSGSKKSVVECKSAKLGLDVRAGGPGALPFVEDRIGRARSQIAKTKGLIDAAKPGFEDYQGLLPLGLIVTAEPVHIANESIFTARLPAAECPTLVVSLKELELLCQLGAEEMIRTIRANVDNPDFTTLTAEYAIRQSTDRLGESGHNQIIEDAFDAALKLGQKVEADLSGAEGT